MPERIPDPVVDSHPDFVGWSDSSARAVLQLMAESVAEMIGFEVATLSVVIDDELVTMAYTGPEEFRAEVFQTDPVSVLDPVLKQAQTWGRFKFLAAELYDEPLEGHWVVTQPERIDHPDAWHPNDVLIGLLCDDEGELRGVMSVDRPLSRLRPDETQRRMLERYAAQAERAVIAAFEREEMLQQIAHAEAARRLIRSTAGPSHASLQAVLQHTHRPLVEGFNAGGSWIQVIQHTGVGYARTGSGDMLDLPEALVDVAHRLAPRLWAEQRALLVTVGESPEVSEEGHAALAEMGVSSALGVALGVGGECIGFLALSRFEDDPPWSQVEIDSALQIGHDLGAALMTARALERERRMVSELQQLDDYRTQLIATLSHELRTPLTVIAGNLELLGGLELEQPAGRLHQAMTRGTDRMRKVVDDLLLLARVSDDDHPVEPADVDLGRVAADVVELVGSTARAKGLALHLDAPMEGVTVTGDAAELDRMVGNLVSNAVKYTPAGGTVTVRLRRREDRVVLKVLDDGIGISDEDQQGLFRAFYRTANPDALRQPGSGLGLAIVAQIVERHHGLIEVGSVLGEGTTFTVTLPVT